MRVKVTLMRRDGSQDDVVVAADAGAKIGEIADTIARVDPRGDGAAAGPRTLEAQLPGQDRPSRLPAEAALGEASIGSGAFVASVEQAMPGFQYPGSQQVRAAVRIDGGRTVELTEGSFVLGRAESSDVVLRDPLVSKRHLRIDVGDEVDVVDLGSANGMVVDGEYMQRMRVDSTQQILVGDTTITVERKGAGVLTGVAPTAGPVPFTRSPRVEARYQGEDFEPPEVPKETDPREFPFLALIAPVLMGLGMFTITGRPMSLLFVVMAPMMMFGNFVTQKRQVKKRKDRDVDRFDERLSALREGLAEASETEHSVRLREAPATQHVYVEAMRHGPLLWTRRPEHWNFLNVRFGLGTMPSRNSVTTGSKGNLLKEYQDLLNEVVDKHKDIAGVPVVENLYDAGALGFAGPPEQVTGSLNAVLLQLTGLHSPSELAIAAMVSPVWTASLQWLTWIPHTSSPHSPLEEHHLADSAGGAQKLLAELEELVSNRLKAQRGARRRGALKEDEGALERGGEVGTGADEAGTKSPVPAVVVLISDDIDVDRSRLIQLAEQGADAGVYPVWIAAQAANLPAACRTFVDLGPEGPRVGMVRLGRWVDDVQLETVDPTTAMEYGRRLAPVFDAGAIVEDASDLPRAVTMPTLLGHDLFESSQAVVERWRQNLSIYDRSGPAKRRKRAGTLRAIVGSAGVDAQHLDLRTQGPHALVGGTTGAGKSEFLQAWVLGMAAEYSPDRVTFLFVDYKGGSAFADCIALPHCVGLVTDLSPALVQRALTSLRAELHHREHLFNRKKVKDLLEMEKRGDPETPPSLVIVVDEFAALVGDVPEFVDGVVDVAQRGRSLGIHLILATQRPAGVIKDNLRANTNMRVALRMADQSDSKDVVDVADAAFVDPALPGRGLVKTGPGRVQAFQSGYAGGWTTREPERAKIEVSGLQFGREDKWEEPVVEGGDEEGKDLGPNDQQRLVARVMEGFRAAGLPKPRRPWLDPVADVYDLTRLRQRTDSELLLGVADVPEKQAQAVMYFYPDQDGNIGIYGTGGAGKSAALRTLGAAAGITPRGGPVHVYGLDFAAGALRMLESLPHVGAIAKGDDNERVVGLMRMLRDQLTERAEAFAAVTASSIVEYRQITGRRGVPRILLLLDGFANFKDDYEIGAGRAEWYGVLRDILQDGRGLGMHVAFTADRAGAIPTYVRSLVQRNVILRMPEDGYLAFGVPKDIIQPTSPPGRAIVDGLETQIAVIGGTTSVSEQAEATERLAESMERAGVTPADPVKVLPREYPALDLPDVLGDEKWPVLGLDNIRLAPFAFDPTGTMVVSGPPGAGRSNALVAITKAMLRANPGVRPYLFAQGRSAIAGEVPWTGIATGPEKVAELAKALAVAVQDEDTEPGILVVIEGINEYLQSPADKPIQELTKAIRKSDHLLVAEAESAAWGASWPLISEVKNGRRGLLLQPANLEGDTILKTSLPRAGKDEFPVGRGAYVARGKHVRVQLPLVLGGRS
ncbi:FtsK/SpoIIIE domain-containing protein [Myceligenerans indicum]|uniref:FHA domain-containing protein n=1 Tax=Myceligenerans indicum TaxID=2593663 RepID=A0ABS1LGW4_9MICO|nr:FtsK/SpoIIIE domain-containing protein [Myceligenerans indicum]MBL0885442.1 FHA domain-containing protein [Myceligenerans indicum]